MGAIEAKPAFENQGLAEINGLLNQAKILVDSGLLPKGVDTPAKAVAIMMKGREIGMQPMQALSSIDVIQGKPCLNAQGMLSQIFKNCKGARIHIAERTDTRCEILASRPGCGATTFAFTLDDAKRAGLLNKESWQKYPRAMLHARCVSEMARSMFPDALSGLVHTAEELGAEVNEEGQTVEIVQASAEQKDTKTETYSGSTQQQQAIMEILKKRGVPETLWGTVHEKMNGRPGKDLPRVIKEVTAAQGAN